MKSKCFPFGFIVNGRWSRSINKNYDFFEHILTEKSVVFYSYLLEK